MAYINQNKYDSWVNKKLLQGESLESISYKIDRFLKKSSSSVIKEKSISKKDYEERKEFLINVKKIIDHDYKLIAGIKVKRKYF